MKLENFTESKIVKGITFNQWMKEHPHDINSTLINCSHSNLTDLNGI